MSADNGIYILETPSKKSKSGYEYRVAHHQAIDNIYWGKNSSSDDPKVWIENCRKWWEGCEVYTDKGSAFAEASRQADDCDILEYGISVIPIPLPFFDGDEIPEGMKMVAGRLVAVHDGIPSDEFLERQSTAEALGASTTRSVKDVRDPAELCFLGFCKDFDRAMGAMRKDGCGLTLGQEQVLRKELGI